MIGLHDEDEVTQSATPGADDAATCPSAAARHPPHGTHPDLTTGRNPRARQIAAIAIVTLTIAFWVGMAWAGLSWAGWSWTGG